MCGVRVYVKEVCVCVPQPLGLGHHVEEGAVGCVCVFVWTERERGVSGERGVVGAGERGLVGQMQGSVPHTQ